MQSNEIPKDKLQAVKDLGVFNMIGMYNKLCPKCKLKSMKAVRRGGSMLKQVFNSYCNECRTMLQERASK